MAGCVFCAITKGQAPAQVVERGWFHVAIVPLNPHSRGHVLFLPRWHVVSATSAPLTAALVVRAAARYLRAQGPQGNLLTSCGPNATQTVDHLHVHVIPRGPSDNVPTDWPWMRGADDA